MVFIEDALSFLGLGKEIAPYPHRVTLFGRGGVIVEGAQSISFYSQSEVVISVKKGEVKIVGEGLKIKKYGDGEVALVGKIAGVCYQ